MTDAADWRPVPGYVGVYEIDAEGTVRRVKPAQSTHYGRVVKPDMSKGVRVRLCSGGKAHHYTVSKLLAQVFGHG